MFCKHCRARAGVFGIVEVVGGLAQERHGRFAEGGQLRRRRVVGGRRGVAELLDEGGDLGLVGRRRRAFVEELEEGRPGGGEIGRFEGLLVRGGEGADAGEAAGGCPADREARRMTNEPTDITDGSVGTPGTKEFSVS